jgi:hypothetical protein
MSMPASAWPKTRRTPMLFSKTGVPKKKNSIGVLCKKKKQHWSPLQKTKTALESFAHAPGIMKQ